MVRNAGAKHVYLASASPPVKYPNVYGIDMPTFTELIAYNRSYEEIAKYIKCDWIVYQTIDAVKRSVKSLEDPKHPINGFDCSCFDGIYVTKDITPTYLRVLGEKRHTKNYDNASASPNIMDLYNYSS